MEGGAELGFWGSSRREKSSSQAAMDGVKLTETETDVKTRRLGLAPLKDNGIWEILQVLGLGAEALHS